MTPASKGSQAKRVPAQRSAASATRKSQAGNKSARTKVGASATRRPVLTKKKAAPVKKAATAPKKTAPAVQKTTSSATKKSTASAAKKTSSPATKRALAPRKAAPPAAAKKAAPAKKAATAAAAPAKKTAEKPAAAKKAPVTGPRKNATGNGAGAATATTTFTPKPKPPAPVRPKTGPYAKDAKFLEEVRDLLLAERAVYQEQAVSLRAEADSLALEREPGDVQFDEESGEGGTVTVDRERNLALSGQAILAVEEIDDALARIADKTYGYCERCFQPIPKPRLRALPFARLCVACKSGGLSRR
jgi:RNA polymerase-binding transcription factor DksA